jgi:hypothetical protein
MGTIIFFIAIALLFKRVMVSLSEKKQNNVKSAKED